jgi:hypothetical protein
MGDYFLGDCGCCGSQAFNKQLSISVGWFGSDPPVAFAIDQMAILKNYAENYDFGRIPENGPFGTLRIIFVVLGALTPLTDALIDAGTEFTFEIQGTDIGSKYFTSGTGWDLYPSGGGFSIGVDRFILPNTQLFCRAQESRVEVFRNTVPPTYSNCSSQVEQGPITAPIADVDWSDYSDPNVLSRSLQNVAILANYVGAPACCNFAP